MTNNPPRGRDRVFVSAFITNHTIPEETNEGVTLFNLQGIGHGHWGTEGDAIEITEADLFVMVTWVGAPRGAYDVVTEVRSTTGDVLAGVHQQLVEIPQPHYVYQWNVPLAGITLPKGMFYLWISVDGVQKAALPMRVFGPEDPFTD